jgi:hypothetical protein
LGYFCFFLALEEGSDVFNFAAKVDSMMEKFYSFKSFLIKCGKLPIDINVAFNLEHLKFQKKVGVWRFFLFQFIGGNSCNKTDG